MSRKRKSRFSEAFAVGEEAPPPVVVDAEALRIAAEKAQAFAATLVPQHGQKTTSATPQPPSFLRQSPAATSRSASTKVVEEKELEINDAPARLRSCLLTKSAGLLDKLMKEHGVSILVKGRYYPPGQKPTTQSNGQNGERPLYLSISPSVHLHVSKRNEALEAAIEDIKRLLDIGTETGGASANANTSANDPTQSQFHARRTAGPQYEAPPPPPPLLSSSSPGIASEYTSAAVVEVGLTGMEPNFAEVVRKLRGPDNSYFRHIESKTMAEVRLLGAGSGTKTGNLDVDNRLIHIHIGAQNFKSMNDARTLAKNLVSTIMKDHLDGSKAPPPPPPPQLGRRGLPPFRQTPEMSKTSYHKQPSSLPSPPSSRLIQTEYYGKQWPVKSNLSQYDRYTSNTNRNPRGHSHPIQQREEKKEKEKEKERHSENRDDMHHLSDRRYGAVPPPPGL